MGTFFYHSSAPLPKVDKVDFLDTVEMFERVDVEAKSLNFLWQSKNWHYPLISQKNQFLILTVLMIFITCISNLAHNECNNFCENHKIHFEIGRKLSIPNELSKNVSNKS